MSPNPESRNSDSVWRTILVPLFLSFLATVACNRAAGASLGLLLGPVLLVGFIAPPLVLGEFTLLRQTLVCAAITSGIGAVWIVASHIELYATVRCLLVVAAYVLALSGAAAFLKGLRIVPILASALTSVLGLAWLTWPVWLSRTLPTTDGQLFLRWMSPLNPLLAINGVVRERFDFWDRYPLAYQQLTTLNQDVLYVLPRSLAPCLAVHVTLGLFLLVWSAQRKFPFTAIFCRQFAEAKTVG